MKTHFHKNACARNGDVSPPDGAKLRSTTLPLFCALALIAFTPACSRDDHDHDDHAGHDHSAHDHEPAAKPSAKDKHDDHDHDAAPTKPSAQKHDDHAGHAHGQDAPESTNVTYNETRGLHFESDTAAAINLTTQRIATRPIAHRVTLNASVIDSGPPVQVTALVAPATAADMERHAHEGVRLIAVNRALTHATAQVEITLALAGSAGHQPGSPPSPVIGDTLTIPLIGPPETALAIPNSAILRTVAGTFAYRHNDGSYQRTPVTLGVTDGAFTEILAGLVAGDEIAATAVEQLWLTELRLTKGGGHSH